MAVVIPGRYIEYLTFPCVILHEYSHKVFCDQAGIPVYEVCYFRFGDPPGYVIHGPVRTFRQLFLITVAPFLVNTVVSFLTFCIKELLFYFIVKINTPLEVISGVDLFCM